MFLKFYFGNKRKIAMGGIFGTKLVHLQMVHYVGLRVRWIIAALVLMNK